ncbi:hypothetical protein TcasGA2_TC010294 [Tribolium castaneum]|uniref:Uncharacterized protein n=1 Tax=Tribolium castaneum TaxID=7070 RepID=D7EJJ5_TRICA|nr:hypothetical protein TcasGA2_TC010294 [Tribolium castaneum]
MPEEQTSDEEGICVNMNEEIDLEEAPLRMASAATQLGDLKMSCQLPINPGLGSGYGGKDNWRH